MGDRPGDTSIPGGTTVYNSYKNSTVDYSSHVHGDCIHNTNHHYHGARSIEGPLDRLEKYVSKGAAHDSAERGPDAPKCFPETRAAVQGRMLSFVDPGGEEKMLWLTGPAGAGKTAILGSIADECHARGWLAASFFFSISANRIDRCSKRYLITTLAYQLFQLDIPGLPAAILASIDANPSVFDKRLDQQVEILLLRPLREVLQKTEPSTWPKVVLVDGVDECAVDEGRDFGTEQELQRSRGSNQCEVLSALTQAAQDPAFPFRIIIASRPETAIHEYFSSLDAAKVEKIVLDSTYNPDADIELYLRAKLTQMGRQYGLPWDWYSRAAPKDLVPKDVPRYLAKEASGQFIYAATIIRFLQNNPDPPHMQLERILSWRALDSSRPFAALDAIYSKILHTSPKPGRAALFICVYDRGWPGVTDAKFWQRKTFLESFQGETEYLLGSLTSLVHLGKRDREPDFQLHHRSLIDFLWSSERSGNLSYSLNKDLISGRFHEIVKTAGRQVFIPTGHTLDQFLPWFCKYLPSRLLTELEQREYVAVDVDWWLANLDSNSIVDDLPYAFYAVHFMCHWRTCRPICKVWRSGILRYAKAKSWRTPTMLEMLRERAGKWQRAQPHWKTGSGLMVDYYEILRQPTQVVCTGTDDPGPSAPS